MLNQCISFCTSSGWNQSSGATVTHSQSEEQFHNKPWNMQHIAVLAQSRGNHGRIKADVSEEVAQKWVHGQVHE